VLSVELGIAALMKRTTSSANSGTTAIGASGAGGPVAEKLCGIGATGGAVPAPVPGVAVAARAAGAGARLCSPVTPPT